MEMVIGENEAPHVDERETEIPDAGFQYTPHTVWMFANEEYEPNPNDEDVEAKVLTPLEFCNNAFVLRNYCTNKEAIEEHARYKKAMEEEAKLKTFEEPKPKPIPIEWEADDLYGSAVGPKGPVGPNPLEVDPSLSERYQEPIVLTPEEEYYYGPMERASPPPIPKPAPPEISKQDNSKQWMSTMSLNEAPQDSYGDNASSSNLEPGIHDTMDWDGHPMENPDLMYFYDEDFRLIPGDVIIFTKPRIPENNHEPPGITNFVTIYGDTNYFEDHGQFRANFLDNYPLLEGDLIVRFGNFNKYWLWHRHSTINFYMYWPGLKPPLSSNKKILHPWYWIDHGLVQYGGVVGPTLPISLPVVEANMPIGSKCPNFQLRNGDVLMHHERFFNRAPPFGYKLECHVWNPMLAEIGEDAFVGVFDRVLRHGMNFQYSGSRYSGMIASVVHVELYYYDEEGNWRYLGRCTSEFSDHIRHKPYIKPLGLVPLAGDIIFDRSLTGRSTPDWNHELNIGGLVSFHTWEFFKEHGREDRPFVWFRDEGKYGVGNVTMVLRLGDFPAKDDWTWKHGEYVKLFILNTRGSSWRLNSCERWPIHLLPNKPNYSWKPYNPDNIDEVPPNFGPQQGDIIVRLSMDPLAIRQKKENPIYVGNSWNPHFQTKVRIGIFGPHIQMEKWDFLLRAGYETNKINPSWTNATVELYFLEDFDDVLRWTCKGRDMYIYGTNYVKGGLEGVQRSGFGDYRVSDIPAINSWAGRPMFGIKR